MIRAKQIGTLSQSARSLILNGSRSGAADGSCACSEDDTCASRRIQTKKDAERREASSSSFTKPTGGVDSSISRDAIKALSSQKNEKCEYSVSQPKVAPYSNPSKRADCVSSYGSLEASDGLHSSPPISDQFVRAGIAAVNFLSDLVHYKIPMSDGAIKSSPDCIVEHTEPFSTPKPSSTAKSFGKGYAKTPPAVTSSPVNSCSGTPGRGSKCNSVTNDGTAVDVDTHDKRMTLCANSRPYYSTCDDQASNGELIIKERPKRLSLRETKNGHHTADTVSRVLQQHMHWGPETEDALSKLNRPLDAYQANQVLKRLQNHALALNYFYWLKCQPGFKHDEHTYTTMVGILGRAKQFGAINRLISQMVAEGCQPNVVTYNRIIHSYGRANYLNESLRVFNRMQEEGCEPDLVTYCTLIDLHAKAGYLDVAMDMYQRMQEAGLSPDTFTYSVIINCLGKAGHLVTAHKLFCEMVNQGCVPNLVTYNIMIALHSKARNYSHALQLYRDMQEAGFQPDKVTYSIIMEVFGHCGYLHEAEEVFMEMTRNNWAPDEPVYGLLVDLWGKAGNVKKAWEWYHAMLCAGPDGQNVRDHVTRFLDFMHSEDRESKRGLVDAVVDFLHKSGLKEEAGSVWEVAAMRNIYPDVVREKSSCYWLINLHVMSDGTAVTALSRTLAWFRRRILVLGIRPSRIDIVTGWGRRSKVTGTSLVRQAVQELLDVFGFPLIKEKGNSGCFVGYGEALNTWLLHPYVERMHLL
ncbi:unnamed protein product [Cuscuta campestris]|uniref:Smr domain-containing protein n=1 Tax=Cuscuta campestris TaxID=132261 RepID=A0A484MDK0_9ASTE|nr:unnamed protein product [Cuscuta campestris]